MAFDQSGFAPLGGENTNSPTIWGYRSADSLTDIQASGYFNPKVYQIEQGDFVFITASASIAFGYFNNDGTNVTTVIIEGSEGIENPWPTFTEVSGDTTITQTVQCLAVDASAGDVTITLPSLGTGNYNIKKMDSSINVVIIDANGSTIDGASTISLTSQYENLTINSTPNEWVRQ